METENFNSVLLKIIDEIIGHRFTVLNLDSANYWPKGLRTFENTRYWVSHLNPLFKEIREKTGKYLHTVTITFNLNQYLVCILSL